jgi:hypothetical protein
LRSRRTWRTAGAVSAVFISGCIYLPLTTTTYNQECQIDEHHMTLEGRQVAEIAGCRNEGCAALLVAAGVVSAATAVVSGSVVVAGNVVYWLEDKGQCARQTKQN